jgi:uncharacterized protein YkwD
MPSQRRPSARVPLGLAALLAITSFVGLLHPRVAFAWEADSYSSASERQLIALTNRSRASAGLRSLRVDSTLTSVARWRSHDMIERDYFSHDIPGYGSVFKKLDSRGYCYTLAGENIGWNTYPDDEATAEIHAMFMDSSGHRRNILERRWETIGVGAYKGSDGKKMWTVLFADKCGSTAKATAKPAPRATPKPKPRATPKPTAKPTPRPIPKPTRTPAPTPTPSPTPAAATPPISPPHDQPADEPAASPEVRLASTDTGLRVATSGEDPGLLETIVGRVAGAFLGT